MFNVLNRKKIAGGILAATMLFSLPVTGAFANPSGYAPAGALYSPVQLHAVPTKQVTYYKTGDASIPDLQWVTTATDLAFLPEAAIGDVTAVVKDGGVYWIGTKTGLQRVDFAESDSRDIVQYFAGPRYLYGGDDNVLALAGDHAGGVWVKTEYGVTHIAIKNETLHEKTAVYENLVQKVNDRRGMVADAGFSFVDNGQTATDYHSPTGQWVSKASTNDNDGLWTTMYAMGEIFRYNALKMDYGASPTGEQQAEIAAAKAAALRATKAVLFLDYVSGRGNGFPARSYMLQSEAPTDDYSWQPTNGFWFHTIVGQQAIDNPDPNGTALVEPGKTPIGYAIARVTDDAMKKKGDTLFPSGGTDVMNYNGLGLSPAVIDKLNAQRPDGQKLGIDIRTNVGSVSSAVYQVLPVMTSVTNGGLAVADHTTNASNKPLFQLTTPVYEEIPTFFNDLFPPSAIVNGKVDQNQIIYKADTSSDEVDGHYALFFTAYKYLCTDGEVASDTQIAELKDLIAQTADRMTNLILDNDRYYIEDATGKSTQWSRWFSKYFNDGLAVMKGNPAWNANVGLDENGEVALSYGYEDGPLNALELMAALKTAIYVTAEAYPQDQDKFKAAYDRTFDGDYDTADTFTNGKGFMKMALEYITRRFVRQSSDAYDVHGQIVTRENAAYTSKIAENSAINATIHQDWTQYVNYSDEELGWFPIYVLVMLEENPARHQQIVAAYDQWFENEVREENPFYTFLYQLAHPGDKTVDLNSAVRFLTRMPEFRIKFPAQYDRQDVLYVENGVRDKQAYSKQTNVPLPTDERRISKHNSNPFSGDAPYAKNADYDYRNGSIDDGAAFTLPYWFGRMYGMIEE